MTVDPIWERIHATREWGKYPPEELVRFAATRFGSSVRKDIRILDVGCGFGSGTWLLAREGFDTSAIDGSASAIRRLSERLAAEALSAKLHVGDIVTRLPDLFQPESFDAIVEITCLCTLPRAEAAQVVRQAARLLKPGGRLFSMTFDVESWGHGLGIEVEPHGFTNIPEGPFKDRGFARFDAEENLAELYHPLSITSLESSTRSLLNRTRTIKQWVIECEHVHG